GDHLRPPFFPTRRSSDLYAMLYKDQLILTGQINDVGAYTRMNVRDSYRIGLELDARWKITKNLDWNASIALSDNKIKNFTEYVRSEEHTSELQSRFDIVC